MLHSEQNATELQLQVYRNRNANATKLGKTIHYTHVFLTGVNGVDYLFSCNNRQIAYKYDACSTYPNLVSVIAKPK